MGLMKRVLTEARSDTPKSDQVAVPLAEGVSREELRPDLVTRTILQELGDIPATIEAPAHVFSMLKRNLELNRAALLLPDPDERTFVPWSLTGFDMTTQRRLHIPEDIAYELFSSRAPTFLVLAKESLKPLASFLSVREYTSVRYLALAGFFYEARLLAILVIGDTPYFGLDHTIMKVMYSAYEGNVSALLFRSRESRISRIQLPLLFSPDQLSPVAHEIVAEHANASITLVFLDFSIDRAVSMIAERARETDEYRIRQDVLRILNTMLAGLGKVFLFPDRRLVLLRTEGTEDAPPLDIDLLVHQINRKLEAFFDELEGTSDIIEYRLLVYPRDFTDLEELISRIVTSGS